MTEEEVASLVCEHSSNPALLAERANEIADLMVQNPLHSYSVTTQLDHCGNVTPVISALINIAVSTKPFTGNPKPALSALEWMMALVPSSPLLDKQAAAVLSLVAPGEQLVKPWATKLLRFDPCGVSDIPLYHLALEDPDENVRQDAAKALAWRWKYNPEAMPLIIQMFDVSLRNDQEHTPDNLSPDPDRTLEAAASFAHELHLVAEAQGLPTDLNVTWETMFSLDSIIASLDEIAYVQIGGEPSEPDRSPKSRVITAVNARHELYLALAEISYADIRKAGAESPAT